jgi:hypothetical protein
MCVLFFCAGPVAAQRQPVSDCAAVQANWEKLIQDLKEQIDQFEGIKKTPVEKIIKRPLVEARSDKTIARQVAEALEAKEEQLNARRKECQSLLNQEEQAFADVERCSATEKGGGRKDVKKMMSLRTKIVQKARTLTVEVQEVEGKNGMNYVDSSYHGPYEGMSRGMRGYWNY